MHASTNFRLAAAAIALSLALPAIANATDFPVTGTLSVNGNTGNLPTGGVFAGSAYDSASGTIAAGAFTFPSSTISFPSDFGTVVVTYELSQTDTSTGSVDADGVAVLSDAAMSLNVTHVTVSGFPVDVGTCVLAPVVIPLAGTASSSGLDLSASAFTIPPVAANACGGNGTQINNAVAGSNNSMHMQMAGDFTPPTDDTIFLDGFESPM